MVAPAPSAPGADPFTLSRIGRHSLIYGGGALIGKAVAFLLLPIYTRYLTPADYGVLRLLEMVLEVASIAAGSRLGAGIFWFYHKAATAPERRQVVSTAAVVLLASYAAASTLLYLIAPAVAQHAIGGLEHVGLVRIAAVNLAFEALLLVPVAYLRLGGKAVPYVAVMTARLLLQVVGSLVFVVLLELGATGVLLSTLMANVIVGAGLMAHLVRGVGLGFSSRAAQALLRFGLPFVATQIATMIMTFGSRWFLVRDTDAATVGLYGLAYQFGFLLAILSEVPFSMVWEPARFEIAKRQDRDQLYARGFRYFNVVLLTVAVGLCLFIGDLLRVVAAPAFHPARDLVPIILIAYVFQSWTMVHDVGIQVKERTELFTLATWAGAAVALAGYVLLIPRFLALGAALATVASFAVRAGLVYAISQRLWPVRYEWGPILRLVALAAITGVAGLLLPQTTLAMSLASRMLLLGAYAFAVWRVGLSADDRRAIAARLEPRLQALATLRRPT